jgi:hypothetical protein
MKNRDRYKTAVADLVTARARPAYSDGDEGERVAELDTIWSMTAEDRDRFDALAGGTSVP